MVKSNEHKGKTSKNYSKILLKHWHVVSMIILLVIAIFINIIHFFFDILLFEKILQLSILLILISIVTFILHEIFELDEIKKSNEKIVFELKNILENHINRISGIVSRTTSFRYVSARDSYSIAKKHLEMAKEVRATFFLRGLWSLQDGERGYKEQIRYLTSKELQERNDYFNKINDQVNMCQLRYDWIILVEDDTKFRALCDRLITIITQSFSGLKEGFVEIHVLPMNAKTYFPLLNFQIAETDNITHIIVSCLSTEARLGDGFTLTNTSKEDAHLIEFFKKWFDLLKKYSYNILSCNKINLQNLRMIGEQVLEQNEVEKELERIVAKLKYTNVEVIK